MRQRKMVLLSSQSNGTVLVRKFTAKLEGMMERTSSISARKTTVQREEGYITPVPVSSYYSVFGFAEN